MNVEAIKQSVAQADERASCNLCGSTRFAHLFNKAGYDLVSCSDCGLAYISNPPDAEALARIYSMASDYHSELLDPDSATSLDMRKLARRHANILRRTVSGGERRKLLDIGCSSGLFLEEARKLGFAVEGVELSPDTAEAARRNFGLTVHSGTLEEAGLAEGGYDVITLFDVIEHVPDPLGQLRHIRRLLKPGGVVLQSTPNIEGLFPRLSYRLARFLDYWPHPEPPHHLFQFSVRTMTEMFARAGFVPGPVHQYRISLAYSFGTPESWKVSPKLMPYGALFAPSAILGPWLGMGDWFYQSARKPVN